MAYRHTKQPDGRYTIHDYSIFATCEKGGTKFDDDWLLAAVETAQAEERNGTGGIPVAVGHNKPGSRAKERDAVARAKNFRARRIPVGKDKRLGIVVDLEGVDEETFNKIEAGNLPGRSIESWRPSTKRIDALAILGATPAFHPLRQGSEPEVHFSAIEDEGVRVEFDSMETFSMDPSAIIQQLQALLAQLGQSMGGGPGPGQPNPGGPAAPARPPAPAHMDAEETEAEPEPEASTPDPDVVAQFTAMAAENAKLQAQIHALQAEAEEDEAGDEVAAALNALESEGAVFDRSNAEGLIGVIGLEAFNAQVAPNFARAPTNSTPKPQPSAKARAFGVFETDEDLKKFSALDDEYKIVALESAQEYDKNLADRQRDPTTPELTEADRGLYIETSVNIARQMARRG